MVALIMEETEEGGGGSSGGNKSILMEGLEELSLSELESYANAGSFTKVKGHKEHVALHPFWLTRPRQGVVEELKRLLGKWNAKLKAYVVGVDSVKIMTGGGAINEDHQWIHLDVKATFYLYQPEVDQVLKGIIKKKGITAAVCVLFGVFTATVFPADENELINWYVGEEIEFSINSFHNRRKGPLIKGNTLTSPTFEMAEETWEEPEPEKTESPTKTKRKKKKGKHKTPEEIIEDQDSE